MLRNNSKSLSKKKSKYRNSLIGLSPRWSSVKQSILSAATHTLNLGAS